MKFHLSVIWMASMCLGMMTTLAEGFQIAEKTVNRTTYLTVETDSLLVYFNRKGGCLDRLYYKTGKQDYVKADYRGAFTENDWNIPKSRDFLYNRPVDMRTEETGDTLTVTCRTHHLGGGLDFLEVQKCYVLKAKSPVIEVAYQFRNLPTAMSKFLYSFHVHTGFQLLGTEARYFIPSVEGIRAFTNSQWEHNPARGWMAASSQQGTGLAITMDYANLHNFLICRNATMEWRYTPMNVKNGESFKTRVTVTPFRGISHVSGAGEGVVGALDCSTDVTGKNGTVRLTVYSASPKTLEAKLFARPQGKQDWTACGEGTLAFPAGDRTSATQLAVPVSGKEPVELEAVLYEKGREVARLNGRMGGAAGATGWRIDPLVKRRPSEKEEIDLTGFTHVAPDAEAIPWAKPLPQGKIKMLVLGKYISQFGDLSHRVDIDYAMSWISPRHHMLEDPAWLLCDYYGQCTMLDVFRNIRQVLTRDYDVIFLGGVPWKLLPADIRSTILQKISRGTGLVYTGAFGEIKEFKLSALTKGYRSKGKVSVTRQSYLTEGVPFDFLPPLFAFRQHGGGEIHATVKDQPFLQTVVYGQGRCVLYCFEPNLFISSLIPDDPFKPYYVYDHPTPFEQYFSMLSKGILYAARRDTGFEFKEFASDTTGAVSQLTWKVRVAHQQQVTLHCLVTDRNNEVRLRQNESRVMPAGQGTLSMAIPLKPYCGQQLVSLIVRNRQGQVLNWGSWTVQKEPDGWITSVKTDREAYETDDGIAYDVRLKGKLASKRVRLELSDSYGRVLAHREVPASAQITGKFHYRNGLAARYGRLRAYLMDGKDEADTNGCSFFIRPADSQMVWDDYLVNSIIYHTGDIAPYRMKHSAGIYRSLGTDTLMNVWGIDYPLLNNFSTHVSLRTGVAMNPYPSAEYLKTLDKKLLVRKSCLSDDRLTQKLRTEIWQPNSKKGYQIGVQFFDTGDETALSRSGGPVDWCYSPQCLARFRQWLKKRYAQLDALNAAWETAFQTWDEVMPFTHHEVWKQKGKHIAGWADHREFMDDLVQRRYELIRKTVGASNPSFRLSNSGTIEPSPFGGLDWWKLMKNFDCLENYNHGKHDEILHSFAKPSCVFIPWAVGYGCRGQEQVYQVWRSAFLGDSGISLWCFGSGLLFPDGTLQSGMRTAQPHVLNLRHGVGKYLMNYARPKPPQIAILYSQASLRAAFIAKELKEYRALWEKYINLCHHVGISFRFISYEELAQGILDDSSFRLLVLPNATALADEEIQAIRRFADNRGVIVAEGMPGTRYANCVKRGTQPLRDLFEQKDSAHLLRKSWNTDYTSLMFSPDSALNRKALLKTQEHFIACALKAGLRSRPVEMLNEDGTPLIEAEYYMRETRDGMPVVGIATGNALEKQALLRIPEPAHVYDLVSGTYLGYGKQFTVTFRQGLPLAIVALKEQPAFGHVSCEDTGKLIISMNHNMDTVVRLRLYDPADRELVHYAANIGVSQGKGRHTIPFVGSDPQGKWRVVLEEVIGRKQKTLWLKR